MSFSASLPVCAAGSPNWRRRRNPRALEARGSIASDLSLALVYSAAKFARQVSPNSVSWSRVRPLSSRRGAAMLPVKPASFPRRVRTSRERTARRRFSDGARQRRCSELPAFVRLPEDLKKT